MVSSADHDMAFLEHMLGVHIACMVSGRQGRDFLEYGQETPVIAMLSRQVSALKDAFSSIAYYTYSPVILVIE